MVLGRNGKNAYLHEPIRDEVMKSRNIKELFDLTGRVAIVSGAAGLFGRQIAESLGEAGAIVCCAGRNLERSTKFVESLIARGIAAEAYTLDQADEGSILALRDEILHRHGRLDVLVNNAVARPMKSWAGSIQEFAESMAINATGIFAMTKLIGEAMASRAGGSVINVDSIQGLIGPDYSLYEGLPMDAPPDYFFHKGGMLQLTRFAAARLGPSGVRVNAICPGGYENGQPPEFIERYNRRTFLGRLAGDDDLKGVIAFLASDASAYITGAVLPVDGGYTAK
jgi:NAD(P)-dependent dehydrogenase (short-subunit alcohol dehydrogenase family)